MERKTWVEISKSALRANALKLKKMFGKNVRVLIVVKGNGYGAGIKALVTTTRSIVDWYGVDSLDEANKVREFCQNPVLILGYVSVRDAAEMVSKNFSCVIYDYRLAAALSKRATKKNPAKVHIKVDSGLIRLGLFPAAAIALAKKIAQLPNVAIEGLCTHYAWLIDDDGDKIYPAQLEKFNGVVKTLAASGIKPELLHTASSVAAFLFPETRFNMVRIGIPLHGLWGRPSTVELINKNLADNALRPIMAWKTKVVNVKKISANTSVGYGRSETVSKETTVAILGAGFYDGIDKRYGKTGSVLINGKKAKMLGSISMNMCAVDASGVKNVKIGDEAVLIGRSGREEITAYDVAGLIETSTYEVISRINPLLPRIIVR
ncbi:MAG: alanine racemase [Minisyncoccia bacterium]